MSAIDELRDRGYTLYESEAPDRLPIDFSIADEEDNVAWVWGDRHDTDFECNHPSDCVEYDDDETVGECKLCGQFCMWHYADDGEGHKERAPHEWTPRRTVGGLIGKILKERS